MMDTEIISSAAEGSSSTTPAKKGFLDLPAEAIALIFENVSAKEYTVLVSG